MEVRAKSDWEETIHLFYHAQLSRRAGAGNWKRFATGDGRDGQRALH